MLEVVITLLLSVINPLLDKNLKPFKQKNRQCYSEISCENKIVQNALRIAQCVPIKVCDIIARTHEL